MRWPPFLFGLPIATYDCDEGTTSASRAFYCDKRLSALLFPTRYPTLHCISASLSFFLLRYSTFDIRHCISAFESIREYPTSAFLHFLFLLHSALQLLIFVLLFLYAPH